MSLIAQREWSTKSVRYRYGARGGSKISLLRLIANVNSVLQRTLNITGHPVHGLKRLLIKGSRPASRARLGWRETARYALCRTRRPWQKQRVALAPQSAAGNRLDVPFGDPRCMNC